MLPLLDMELPVMNVVIKNGSETRRLDNIIEVNKNNNTYEFVKIDKEEISFNKKWQIRNIRIYDPDVNVNDWVKYIEDNRIQKGRVSDVREDEIIVKQLPDGWQVSINEHQVLESRSDM